MRKIKPKGHIAGFGYMINPIITHIAPRVKKIS